MYHSITFGQLVSDNEGTTRISGKNTWDDWHLIPSSRPSVTLPEPNANMVDIPFRDGGLDISEAVTGYMTYKDRSGSWEFYIANDYHYWVTLKQTITNYLHGRKMYVVLEDDPEYYYEGRLKVDDFKSQKVNSTITIGYVLKPYKRSIISTGEDWLWDPFNFDTGVIQNGIIYDVPGTATIIGGRMRVSPTIITSTSGITVSLNGSTPVLLNSGTNYMSDMFLEEGENVFTFAGSGTVKIDYREGSL